jgi:hypothetical protein
MWNARESAERGAMIFSMREGSGSRPFSVHSAKMSRNSLWSAKLAKGYRAGLLLPETAAEPERDDVIME